MTPDYQKVAGDFLFGSDTLDNATRGLFLEAVIMHALLHHDDLRGATTCRWLHAGAGWGPWDLQRGTSAGGDRVRFQVKVKAARQLWKPPQKSILTYNLGWKTTENPPAFVEQDFPRGIYGECEALGHRCDVFLFAWHGANPINGNMRKGEQQSDPHNYDYFVVPCSELASAKSMRVRQLFEEHASIAFAELPDALNAAADRFLIGARSDARPSPSKFVGTVERMS